MPDIALTRRNILGAHLTDALVKRLPKPDRGNRLTFDDAVSGFAARITSAGHRGFVLNLRGKCSCSKRVHNSSTVGSRPLGLDRCAPKDNKRWLALCGEPMRCRALQDVFIGNTVALARDQSDPGIERNIEFRRRRYLKSDEQARLIQALTDHQDLQIANIIRLLLLTGARKGEILGMRWADLDLAAGIGASRQARPSRSRTTSYRCRRRRGNC